MQPSLRDRATVVTRPSGVQSAYGTTYDWASAVRTQRRAEIQPASPTTEINVGEQRIMSRWFAMFERGTVITEVDRVEWRGYVFEVDGEIGLWVASHIELYLRRVKRA